MWWIGPIFFPQKQPFLSFVTSFFPPNLQKNFPKKKTNTNWNISMTSLMNRRHSVLIIYSWNFEILEYWSWGYWAFFLNFFIFWHKYANYLAISMVPSLGVDGAMVWSWYYLKSLLGLWKYLGCKVKVEGLGLDSCDPKLSRHPNFLQLTHINQIVKLVFLFFGG